ncbi:MAG TPA: ATP-binding protein [Pyrinomonadaceae bacterium]|jgi:hypothetical protein
MTFNLPLQQINAAQLETLRADSVREGRQLDYKEILPGNSDDDKREFLSDVTSFANAAGGDLLFGIRERREAGRPTGEIEDIPGLPGLNGDAEQLRLEALIRDGVTYKNLSRFYSRTSAGKYQLDVHEIRAGFVAAEMAYERLRRLRAERIARVLALDTPTPIAEGPKLILHALPVSTIEEVWPRVLAIMVNREGEYKIASALAPIGGLPDTWRFNLDGFVAHTLRDDLSRESYTQLFRDGGVEVVSGRLIVKDERRGGFYAWGMEQNVIAGLARYQKFWQEFGVTPPVLLGITLSGVKGWKVLREAYGFSDVDVALDRDVVSPPDVILSDLASPADVILHPLFDFVWNGGGWPGSPNYREGRRFAPS